MKKYNVFSLNVVKVEDEGTVRYFICNQSILSNSYTEVFTGLKVIPKDESCINPLAQYYSILEICDYNTQMPLMLTKEQLLKKYIDINKSFNNRQKKRYLENKKLNPNTVKTLEKATTNFFPKSGRWSSECFRMTNDNLLCHLRNNYWLATKLQAKQGLENISINEILDFIRTSTFFEQQRHDYEQKVVKWQIEWMRQNYQDKNLSENCDIEFRHDIVNTLSTIGLDYEAIEEGIEANENLWRDSLMTKAFKNKYEYNLSTTDVENSKIENEEHFKAWLKMRRYQYYLQHRKSIEEYGKVNLDMKMSTVELQLLRNYLIQEDVKRMKYLEKNGEKSTTKRLIKQ